MKPTANIVLDTRKKLTNGKHHVSIRIGFKFDRLVYKYYPTGIDMFPEEYKRILAHPDGAKAMAKLTEATALIDQNPHISPEDFDMAFGGKGNFQTVQGIFEIMMDQAKTNGQVSTFYSYRDASNSLTRFVKARRGSENGLLQIGAMTPEFLHEYEEWMIETGHSYNTVGLYTRNMRVMYNWAIVKKIVRRDQYPFGRGLYVTPAASARKMALTPEQKDLFISQCPTGDRAKAHDFWKLSYFCFGMNIADIIRWRNRDIGQDAIRVYRTKTARKKRVKEKLEIPITSEIMAIVRKWGKLSLDPDAYVFDVLQPGLTPFQEDFRKKDFIDFMNTHTKAMARELGLPQITTYTARHTCAYMLKLNNVPLPMIQEVFGHEDQRTTENYMTNFRIEEKASLSRVLYTRTG